MNELIKREVFNHKIELMKAILSGGNRDPLSIRNCFKEAIKNLPELEVKK